MNIVDSSAWLEYFAGTKNAANFANIIEDHKSLIVPSITIYEIFKKVLSEKGESDALHIIAHVRLGKVVDLDMEIALLAAQLSHKHKLPMADSIIIATAEKHNATVWTQDSDFNGLKNVKYFPKA